MSVQVRVRAGILVAASAVIVSGLGYGAAAGGGPAGVLQAESVAATAAPTAAKVTAAAVTTKKVTPAKKTTPKKTTPKKTTPKKTTPKKTVPPVVRPVGTPTTLTMTPLSATVTQAHYYRAIFHATLTNTKTKGPLGDQKVTLYRRLPGSTVWTQLVWDKSDVRTGKVFLAVEQTAATADYKMVFAGKSPYAASSSSIITVKRG